MVEVLNIRDGELELDNASVVCSAGELHRVCWQDMALALHLRDLDLEHGGHCVASCVTRPFKLGFRDRVRGAVVVRNLCLDNCSLHGFVP